MISTTYDPDSDAIFIRFAAADVKSVQTEEVSPGVMLDFADDGRMIAIEVLGVHDRVAAHAKVS